MQWHVGDAHGVSECYSTTAQLSLKLVGPHACPWKMRQLQLATVDPDTLAPSVRILGRKKSFRGVRDEALEPLMKSPHATPTSVLS